MFVLDMKISRNNGDIISARSCDRDDDGLNRLAHLMDHLLCIQANLFRRKHQATSAVLNRLQLYRHMCVCRGTRERVIVHASDH